MEMKFWNAATKAISPYVAGEQPKTRCIKLNTNENPYPPSSACEDVLRSVDVESLRKYPDPTSAKLREAVAGVCGVETEMVFTGNGSDEVLAFAFRAFFDEKTRIAFADITYSFYPVYTKSLGIPYSLIAVRDDLSIDVERYIAFKGGVIIANPNAPTGILTDTTEIRRIVEADPDRLVIVDEAYIDFGGESAAFMTKEYDNLLVVQTVSKSRALAGIRVGYAIGNPALIKALERVRDTINSYTVDSVAQAVAAAALKDDEWFEVNRGKIIASRKSLTEKLAEMGFETLPSAANFVFTTKRDVDARMLYEELKKKGILIRYFDLPRIDGYLRITVGTPEENEALCDALSVLVPASRKA
ncbi:MAG: histidinol-phosphate transaminase [Eubacteriales bacterium]|nr:histidinol-phosphate transaminase [Eubacteriales bacterium]